MVELSTTLLPPPRPATPVTEVFGSRARRSPVAMQIPFDGVSTNRMPATRLNSSNTSRARCFWFSVMTF